MGKAQEGSVLSSRRLNLCSCTRRLSRLLSSLGQSPLRSWLHLTAAYLICIFIPDSLMIFQCLPFKFHLQLKQLCFPFKYLLAMMVLYVIPSYSSLKVLGFPLQRIWHIRVLYCPSASVRTSTNKQPVTRCWQTNFGGLINQFWLHMWKGLPKSRYKTHKIVLGKYW